MTTNSTIELEKSLQDPIVFSFQSELDPPSSLYKAPLVGLAVMAIWGTSLICLLSINIEKWNALSILAALVWQTFLYTGLFITAHDAMHGAAFPGNIKINHFIGSLCLLLYGCLSYKKLLRKHWHHHQHPASELDPDFHNGKHKNFFAWYFHFMKRYWSWSQIITLMIIFNLVVSLLHVAEDNMIKFWMIPSILSSLQLFYFGTFEPHREPASGYSEPHHSQTMSRPEWLSFITCYHFGYHEEHHEYPNIPWWGLPKVYKLKKSEV